MKTKIHPEYAQPKIISPENNKTMEAYEKLRQGVLVALETYSNVHRGSGHYSMATTHLFEQARDIILQYLGLNKNEHVVIFCTPRSAEKLKTYLKSGSYQSLSSMDIGLPLGVRVLVVKRKALPGGAPFQAGGGTARLISRKWVVWAKKPGKFEAGTPPIINIIAFARALQLIRNFGENIFRFTIAEKLTAAEILYHDNLEVFSDSKLLNELRQTLIGWNIQVPTMKGIRSYINLDNGASTPAFAPIWEAVYQTWIQTDQTQKEIVREVKSVCAKALGAPAETYDVIFTSNTTEAINLAAESLRNEPAQDTEPVVLNTLLEHNSNELPWRMLQGFSRIRLSVDAEGFINPNQLETYLRSYNLNCEYGKKRIKLVAVSGASNVLGTFNNLAKISHIAHLYGARLLVDAAQMVAHRKIEMEKWGIDYLAFSAHKMYAPFGSGALIVRKGILSFSPDKINHILSSGEENAGGIAALGKAFILLQRIGFDAIQKEEQLLTARLLDGMEQIHGMRIYGIKDTKSPKFSQKGGVIVFSLKKMMADKVAEKLALEAGIGVRYGCHCTHMMIKHLLNVSPFLEQLQRMIVSLFPGIELPGVTRISIGIQNTEKDIDECIHTLCNISGKSSIRAEGKVSSELKDSPGMSAAAIKSRVNDFIGSVSQRVYDRS